MKKNGNKIMAVVAVIMGILPVITGTRVLLGLFDPGYATFTALISYNVLMGIVSIVTGYLIWQKHRQALLLSGIIAAGHGLVLLSLLTVFKTVIATQSIKAMIFRSVIWVVLFLLVRRSAAQASE